ncbi:kinase-like domain-containing protein [Leptodontidium sp. MPI-SDFR-AT-0119]|nr:kinase-like domain-containing protein [Leptodontidium sp. MPI-SDFR-AT-0119]
MSNTLLGIGGSSIVTTANDGKTVLKGYEAWDGDHLLALREENGCEKLLAKEDHVYRLLGEHPHILRCYGLVEVHPSVHSLRLERALHGNVREFIRNNKTTPLSEEDRLNMALGVSSGIAHMHSRNIIHCDISCRNLLLFPDWRVKVGDFGSARDGNPSENNIVEEIRYELPLRGRAFEDRPYIKRELFALGSAIYEIMAWEMPFEELGTDDVEKKYAAEEFPDVTCVLAGDIIRDCWDEKFDTAEDIEGAIQKLQQKRQSGALSKPMDITLDLCDMPHSLEM